MKLLFVLNPKSGKGLIKSHLVNIVDLMVKAGHDVTIYTTQSQGDGIRKIREDAKNYEFIVCSGGDGTLDEIVTGMQQSGVNLPIGYIPAGSTNDFANSLGIPKVMEKAAKLAMTGEPFKCDVGYFNGDNFVYVAAFGAFTELTYQTSQQMKNVLGHAAYVLEGIKRLSDIKSFSMQIEHDGNVYQDKFILGMITNSTSVGGFKGITGTKVELDDGVFEVTFIKAPKNPIELQQILTGLLNRSNDTDMILSFKTSELKVTSKEVIPWTLDGEYGGDHTEVVIKNLKQQVTIIC